LSVCTGMLMAFRLWYWKSVSR